MNRDALHPDRFLTFHLRLGEETKVFLVFVRQ